MFKPSSENGRGCMVFWERKGGGNSSLRVEARITHKKLSQNTPIYCRNQVLASKYETWALSVIKVQV